MRRRRGSRRRRRRRNREGATWCRRRRGSESRRRRRRGTVRVRCGDGGGEAREEGGREGPRGCGAVKGEERIRVEEEEERDHEGAGL
eukprot:3831532-Rhodomonas_salina.1